MCEEDLCRFVTLQRRREPNTSLRTGLRRCAVSWRRKKSEGGKNSVGQTEILGRLKSKRALNQKSITGNISCKKRNGQRGKTAPLRNENRELPTHGCVLQTEEQIQTREGKTEVCWVGGTRGPTRIRKKKSASLKKKGGPEEGHQESRERKSLKGGRLSRGRERNDWGSEDFRGGHEDPISLGPTAEYSKKGNCSYKEGGWRGKEASVFGSASCLGEGNISPKEPGVRREGPFRRGRR